MSENEKRQVIKAIGDLGYRMTVADVSSRTGLPVEIALKCLNDIAVFAGGHLEVGESGNITYCFPTGLERLYLARGLRQRLYRRILPCLQSLKQVVRASFGFVLVASLFFTPLFVAVQLLATLPLFCFYVLLYGSILFFGGDDEEASLSDEQWERLARSIKRHKGVLGEKQIEPYTRFKFILHSQAKLYRLLTHFGGHLDMSSGGEKIYLFPAWETISLGRYRGKGQQGFIQRILASCFSFLFGGADPNGDLKERRWRLIAEMLRIQDGAATCEQFAPYSIGSVKAHDETSALPVLLRFNGSPAATEHGNIVYLFPSLQATALDQAEPKPPPYLEEQAWTLCDIPLPSLWLITIIAVLNLASNFIFWYFFRHPEAGLFTAFADGLLIYSTLVLLLPAGRWVYIQYSNALIDERNQMRARWAHRLENPPPKLAAKLSEAGNYALPEVHVLPGETVYATDRELSEQDLDHPGWS